jgi:hypothetical protein
MVNQTLKSRWFATGVHLGLWALLAAVAIKLGGASQPYLETASHTTPPHSPVPVARLDRLFESLPAAKAATNSGMPSFFATTYFVPPPPPPPTTRKVAITYLGFYQTGELRRRVFLNLDEVLQVCSLGDQIATNLFVAEANVQSAILTNSAAQTNVLMLNAKKVVEVPLR